MYQNQNDFRSLGTHPYAIMMYLFLAGLTMLFLALTGSYLYTRFSTNVEPIKVPFLFLFNTAVLSGSSFFLKKAKKAYLDDDTQGYQKALWGTFLLTLTFMGLQYVAWQILLADNPNLAANGNMRAYVWAISIIHFFHILGGLPFFAIFLYTAYKRMKEPVSVLVYFADPVKQLRLRLLTMYWRFLDILWLYLIAFFWLNYFF